MSPVQLLSSLAVTSSQVALVADMSEEIAPFWPGYFKNLPAICPHAEDSVASHSILEIIVDSLLRAIQNNAQLPALAEPIFTIFLEYCAFMRGVADEAYGASFLGSAMNSERELLAVKTQIMAAEHLNGGIDKAIYLLYVLPNILHSFPFGIMAARMYSAVALMQCGYFPAPLVPESYPRTVQLSEPSNGTSQIITCDFIGSYRRASRKILGNETRAIALIDKQVSSIAKKVFGDPVVALRWLNKPAKRYYNRSPREAARTGYLHEVQEHLIGIDQGFLG